ncbi:hypothetical protein RM545_14585 [Zunongwangia sp. F260]|uniref:Tissue inhibitor of metalloproteinase n=1 Tax=Autumnicola lenta TaxID=3075593 RepID=A0ABU3CNI8_9FLAO|nr:hypothetical protein [Zunongwangia sp. F260]MDT0647924.1 hypothetical protein [Zunongwangia sp. F260]
MKTTFIFTLLVFITIKGFACSCETLKSAIEFHQSKYVFEGEVIEKVYASDSLTNTITFEISKHYKNGDNPKFLKFQLNSEAEVTGLYSSCYWIAKKGQKWLVYAKTRNGKLNFQFFCSNSKPLERLKIHPSEQKVLDNGNNLDLTKYRYIHTGEPITSIDSIENIYKKYKFDPSDFAFIRVDVDEKGRLERANLVPRGERKFEVIDTIFGMNNFKNERQKLRTEFEEIAVEVANKIKSWEKYYVFDLKRSVKYRAGILIEVNKDSIIKIRKPGSY